ncbi:MAG: ROK family protein [Cypionkella sp.]
MSGTVLKTIDGQSSGDAFAGREATVTAAGRDGGRLLIGVDLGGTKLLGAVAQADGTVLAAREVATGGAAVVDQLCSLVQTLLAEVGAAPGRLAQVVIGVPGVVDAKGAVSLSPHVVFEPGMAFADAVGKAIGVPVFADNDANIAAFGEYSVQTEPKQSGVVLVTVGTGVGMGIVVNGEILRGAHGAAGEIGSMPFSGSVPLAQVGHYEGLVSTSGILAGYRVAGGERETVREIFDAAEGGSAIAQAAVEQALDDLANGLGVVVSLLDPGLIVLGGGIGARAGVAGQVAERLAALVPTPCAVIASRLGTRAGLVGALAMAARLAGPRIKAAAREAMA